MTVHGGCGLNSSHVNTSSHVNRYVVTSTRLIRYNMENTAGLVSHAELTVKTLESLLAKRGMTRGKTKWELRLLYSAYEALGTPSAQRKFELDKVSSIGDIQRTFW